MAYPACLRRMNAKDKSPLVAFVGSVTSAIFARRMAGSRWRKYRTRWHPRKNDRHITRERTEWAGRANWQSPSWQNGATIT